MYVSHPNPAAPQTLPATSTSVGSTDPKRVDSSSASELRKRIGLNIFERAAKRLFDLASVVVILALFWWVIIGVFIAVRWTTGSPVIFGHTRVGRGGRKFKC